MPDLKDLGPDFADTSEKTANLINEANTVVGMVGAFNGASQVLATQVGSIGDADDYRDLMHDVFKSMLLGFTQQINACVTQPHDFPFSEMRKHLPDAWPVIREFFPEDPRFEPMFKAIDQMIETIKKGTLQ